MAALAFHAAVACVASLTGPRRRNAARSSSSRRRGDDDDVPRGSRRRLLPRRISRRASPSRRAASKRDERRYYDGGRRSSRVNDYYDRRARPTGDSRPAMEPRGDASDPRTTPPGARLVGDASATMASARGRLRCAPRLTARAAREESMWRDAYAKRVREKRRRWDEWDDMAAEEDSARKDRVARARSAKPAFKTPEQRRDRLARYRDISRRADETWASAIERRWTADEEYARDGAKAAGRRPGPDDGLAVHATRGCRSAHRQMARGGSV